MRILGIDMGQKRIGLAISDELGITAQGLTVIERGKPEVDLCQLRQIILENKITKIVVGLPKNMNGTLGPSVNKVKNFIALLNQECPLEIIYWDERLTTIEARRVLIESNLSRKKRKKVIDKLAAVIILQNYLDSRT